MIAALTWLVHYILNLVEMFNDRCVYVLLTNHMIWFFEIEQQQRKKFTFFI